MEEKSKINTKNMCECSGGYCLHSQPGLTRRVVIMVLLVVLSFWFGMRLGEIKGLIIAEYGHTPMHQRGVMMYDMRSMNDMGDRKEMKADIAAPVTPEVAPVN